MITSIVPDSTCGHEVGIQEIVTGYVVNTDMLEAIGHGRSIEHPEAWRDAKPHHRRYDAGQQAEVAMCRLSK
ncbi:MAG TPA: hypothetical protein PKI03_16235 [Pseudomonadota bacterium]|nr:hypothetical protein [Pseudomonadota bacterium]